MGNRVHEDTMTWAVLFVRHTVFPPVFSPRLFIEEVPYSASAKEVQEFVNSQGYKFGEFGIAWADYTVAREDVWDGFDENIKKEYDNEAIFVPTTFWEE